MFKRLFGWKWRQPTATEWWGAMQQIHAVNPSYRLPQLPVLGPRS